MVEVLSRQEWRDKIPAGLPPGLLVANKTGGVTGTSNDAAIVFTPSGRALVMVVYIKGLPERSRGQASGAIASIACALYEEIGEPA
jgi:beta-lactamase class A